MEYSEPDFDVVITTRDFDKWILRLRDKTAQGRISMKLDYLKQTRRITSDWKRLEGYPGLYELRYTFGKGYRIYFSRENNRILLLLAGSSKRDQTRAIKKASSNRAMWRERNENN